MTSDEVVEDIVRRVVDLAETGAMGQGISPLRDYEVDLIISGAKFALTALAEMSRE